MSQNDRNAINKLSKDVRSLNESIKTLISALSDPNDDVRPEIVEARMEKENIRDYIGDTSLHAYRSGEYWTSEERLSLVEALNNIVTNQQLIYHRTPRAVMYAIVQAIQETGLVTFDLRASR